MVREGAPSTSLFGRTKDVDAGLRRHDVLNGGRSTSTPVVGVMLDIRHRLDATPLVVHDLKLNADFSIDEFARHKVTWRPRYGHCTMRQAYNVSTLPLSRDGRAFYGKRQRQTAFIEPKNCGEGVGYESAPHPEGLDRRRRSPRSLDRLVQILAPHLLQRVDRPGLRLEQMHHEVAGIDQHPVGPTRTLDLHAL